MLLCSLLTQLRAEDADPEALLASSFRQFQLQRALPALQAAIASKVLLVQLDPCRCSNAVLALGLRRQ
jgi:hypothetical protein